MPEPTESGAPAMDAARARLSAAQTALLSSLVAGGPDPEGFDAERLEVQRRALVAKRADVVAKVAPELPRILGEKEFRGAFVAYARGRPMSGGYRRDAMDFAEWLLVVKHPMGRRERARVRRWYGVRAAPRPPLLFRLRNGMGLRYRGEGHAGHAPHEH